MLIESRVEKTLDGLRAAGLPLTVELWNGKRYQLSGNAPVTLRIPAAGALRYFVGANLAKLGEAYVEGHIDVEGPIREVLRAAEGLSRFLGGDKKGRLPRLLNVHSRARDAKGQRQGQSARKLGIGQHADDGRGAERENDLVVVPGHLLEIA